MIKKTFVDNSYFDLDNNHNSQAVYTWVIEENDNVKKSKEERDITDLISII